MMDLPDKLIHDLITYGKFSIDNNDQEFKEYSDKLINEIKMLTQEKINYTNERTNLLHDLVDELFEAMMDGDDEETTKVLKELGKQVRVIRNDTLL